MFCRGCGSIDMLLCRIAIHRNHLDSSRRNLAYHIQPCKRHRYLKCNSLGNSFSYGCGGLMLRSYALGGRSYDADIFSKPAGWSLGIGYIIWRIIWCGDTHAWSVRTWWHTFRMGRSVDINTGFICWWSNHYHHSLSLFVGVQIRDYFAYSGVDAQLSLLIRHISFKLFLQSRRNSLLSGVGLGKFHRA